MKKPDFFDFETDALHQLDRDWFERNPGRRIYLRPAIGSEKQGGSVVAVARLMKGLRIRTPFAANPMVNWRALNEDEDTLRIALRASPMAGPLRPVLGD